MLAGGGLAVQQAEVFRSSVLLSTCSVGGVGAFRGSGRCTCYYITGDAWLGAALVTAKRFEPEDRWLPRAAQHYSSWVLTGPGCASPATSSSKDSTREPPPAHLAIILLHRL